MWTGPQRRRRHSARSCLAVRHADSSDGVPIFSVWHLEVTAATGGHGKLASSGLVGSAITTTWSPTLSRRSCPSFRLTS